ncbi:MAG: hypothetical protein V3T62_04395 [Alphaproteobacteria bacterium]
MNIKADHALNLQETLAGLGESNIVYIDRRTFEGKLRYVILDGGSAILGVADERDVAFAVARQHGLEPVSAH